MPRLLGSNKKSLPATLISSFGTLSCLWEANSSQRQIEHFRGSAWFDQNGVIVVKGVGERV